MSLLHCKKVYTGEGEEYDRQLSILPLKELRTMPGVTVCEGFVMEAEKFLYPKSKTTEFTCVMCGRTFTYDTQKYIKVLDWLGIDYSGRLP